MAYKFLDHTADIGIAIEANNLKNAFVEAIYALLELIFNKSFKELNIKGEYQTIEIMSIDIESLFVDTMNDMLFLIDSRKIIPLKPEIIELSNNSVKINYIPFEFDYDKLPMHLYVKAVTYHQLEIIVGESKSQIKFYVDI